jgi:hypothetical protein
MFREVSQIKLYVVPISAYQNLVDRISISEDLDCSSRISMKTFIQAYRETYHHIGIRFRSHINVSETLIAQLSAHQKYL